jgi:hypothetical protein
MDESKSKALEAVININSLLWEFSKDDKELQEKLAEFNIFLRSKRK